MNVIDDVFQLASELSRRFPNQEAHECNIAQEKAEFMTDKDFIYQHPETPYYFEKNGLMEIQSTDWAYMPTNYWIKSGMRLPGDSSPFKQDGERELSFFNSLKRHNMVVRGFFAVSFNMVAISDWIEQVLKAKYGVTEDLLTQVPEGWKWLDKKEVIYQFGDLGDFQQKGAKRGLVFREAMDLFSETPQTISIKTLSQRTKLRPDDVRITLNGINERLMVKKIKFEGSKRGYYRIVKLPNPSQF